MCRTAVVLACLFSVARRQNNAAQSTQALRPDLRHRHPRSAPSRAHGDKQQQQKLPRVATLAGNRYHAYRSIFWSNNSDSDGCAFTISPLFQSSKHPRSPCCTAANGGGHRSVGASTSSPPPARREPWSTVARTPAVAALLASQQALRGGGSEPDKVAPRPWAVVFEVGCNNDGTGAKLATGVDGTLRRLLGSKQGLRLLREGGYRAATMTSLNFLVMRGGMRQDGLKRDGGGSSNVTGLLGLGLGDCRWTVTGDTYAESEDGPALEYFSPKNGSEKSGVKEIADRNASRQAVELFVQNLAPIVSTTEIFPATFRSTRPKQRRQHDVTVRRFPALLHAMGKSVGRSIVRSRAKTVLANNKDEPDPGARDSTPDEEEMETRSKTGLGNENPLLQVGVGQLFSPQECDKMISEAQKTNAWKRWDGDSFGDDRAVTADAMSFAELPETRALWEGASGEAVRERIANTFRVQSATGILLAEADNVFVCRVGMQRCDEATPLENWPGSTKKRVKNDENMPFYLQVDGFRRSKSLVTFTVALSPDGPEWAVCLEQRGYCVRPAGQGTGVIFSGKLRHAVASLKSSSPQNSRGSRAGFPTKGGGIPRVKSAVFVLRGFASIRDPSVREDVARWRWGCPVWNLDAPWIQDEDILNRAWIGGRRSTSLAVDKGETGVRASSKAVREEPPTRKAEIAMKTPTTAAEVGVETDPSVAEQQQQPLRRMNSTLAHRYYKQGGGCGGMEIPVLDEEGRPVIDLVPTAPKKSWPLPWARGRSPGGPGGEKDVTINAILREKFPWNVIGRRRRQVGRVGLSLEAGASPRMDAALRELLEDQGEGGEVVLREEHRLAGVLVPPIKYVYVDPRYRGLRLGRRLFLEAMCYLAHRGYRFALIIVEDNGTGGLFEFYEEMGFVKAEGVLGIPRAMIAPIPPPPEVLER